MCKNMDVTDQTAAPETDTDNIMQHIQDMIGNLLKDAVDNIHQSETSHIIGGTTSEASDKNKMAAQMDIDDIRNFIGVMQKFIDNVNVIVAELETGITEPGSTDDKFLDGYMATADSILEMAAFSTKDALTGLSNRYGFDNRLILELNRATRDKSALALVIFSLDDYAKFDAANKRDDCMKAIANILEHSIKRSTDFVARWSEDEFAALLPITNAKGASIVADRICEEIGDIEIPDVQEKGRKSSVSIGVCVHTPTPNEQPIDFIHKAHDAYLKAKKTEGNSVVFD